MLLSCIFSKSELLLIAAFWLVNIQATWIEYELVRVDNSKEGLVMTDLKSKRIDKATFALLGRIIFSDDFSNDYDGEVKLFRSPGNNQFVLTPYKVPKDDLCNLINGVFRKSVEPSLQPSSDLPKAEKNESLCANYKKGTYTVKQYLLEKSIVPKILQTGYYKAEFIVSKKNSDVFSKVVVHVKLY